MAEKDKVMTMVLNVDLQCSKCYKKIKKLLCKFPEIRDQTYDEKTNKVTIKVVCCSPEEMRDKLCCKGGGSIKSIEIKDDVLKPVKVTTMVLYVVDLQCLKCYKKVKKLLCKFPEIRDQTYDEKANKVTIKVVSDSPVKISDKLLCKSCGCIKSIEMIKAPPPKPKPKPIPNGGEDTSGIRPPPPAAGQLRYPPPASPVIEFWCGESSSHSGIPGNPSYRGVPVHYVGYYGRPVNDSWGGAWCDHFSEENQQTCSIM